MAAVPTAVLESQCVLDGGCFPLIQFPNHRNQSRHSMSLFKTGFLAYQCSEVSASRSCFVKPKKFSWKIRFPQKPAFHKSFRHKIMRKNHPTAHLVKGECTQPKKSSVYCSFGLLFLLIPILYLSFQSEPSDHLFLWTYFGVIFTKTFIFKHICLFPFFIFFQ